MPFTSPKSEPKDDPKSSLKTFLQQSPTTQYTFDSERGSDHSEICRNTKDGKKECADIWLNSMQMFAAMQDNGFYCALPMEPGRTYMDCKPIPKS